MSSNQTDRIIMRLGERLVAAGKLSERDLERALLAQQEMGDLIGRVLVRLGLVSEADLVRQLADQLSLPLVGPADFPADEPLALDGLAHDFLLHHRLLPLRDDGQCLHVAMALPQDEYARKALRLATGRNIQPCLAAEADLDAALTRLYIGEESPAEDETGSTGGTSDNEFIEHLKDLASEAPVIRLVNQIIGEAINRRASDIHIEPFEGELHVRYRVDGVIEESEAPPASLTAAITSRIKLLAGLNIAERRLPQDGRIKTRVKGHELDLRVSTVPTVHGESVVLRVLDRESIRFSLEDMGFSPDTLQRFNALLAQPHGIVLVTGPTGSGKTTTLYAALAKLDAVTLKILTVEDPVEYQLAGINQIQVQPQIGLTFANALRSILRQDPDIIMIGEMRDTETAEIAVQSALTGHLVLSTLHTNTAAGAITRLEDMGLARYLLTSSVNGILAQRLVRRLCPYCREAQPLDPGVRQATGLERFLPPDQTHIHVARGCEHCARTGYRGRTAIHELLVLDAPMHTAILNGSDANTLHQTARQGGMLTLYEDGLRKVAAGETSLEEVLRVTQDTAHG
ncbi:MAG: type II secretion system ATPase GspE [Pseudomonadota bacterium]